MKLVRLLPARYQLPCKFHYRKLTNQLDFSMSYIVDTVTTHHRVIDVGASIGVYSYFFSQQFEFIEAFEPQIDCASALFQSAKRIPNLRVHCTALSGKNTVLPLYIPVDEVGAVKELATFNQYNTFRKTNCLKVPACKLDDYSFKQVSLIKIDVEGHEINVLSGAEKTISANRPFLLVEIEQRHIGQQHIYEVFDRVLELGYKGYFFIGKKRFPLSEFVYEIHQKPFIENSGLDQIRYQLPKTYINNFVFEPI